MNKPQDGEEGPHPPEVDVAEMVAQLLHQPHALLIALRLGTGRVEAMLGRRRQKLHTPTLSPYPPHPLTALSSSTWIVDLYSFHLSQLFSLGLCLFSCLSMCLSLSPYSLHLCILTEREGGMIGERERGQGLEVGGDNGWMDGFR